MLDQNMSDVFRHYATNFFAPAHLDEDDDANFRPRVKNFHIQRNSPAGKYCE